MEKVIRVAQGRHERWSPSRAALAALPCLVLLLATVSPARAGAAVDCESAICITLEEKLTNSHGQYNLFIPADYVGYEIPELNGCSWQVEAQFGDGSAPEHYEFHEEALFLASHLFPGPGHYQVVIDATEGKRSDESKCPDVHIEVPVTFSAPPPPEETEEPTQEGPAVQVPGGGGATAANPGAASATVPTPGPNPYWRACGGGIRSHLVVCRRAQGVIAAARDFLSHVGPAQGGAFTAAGFSCRRRGGSPAAISCRRGRQRVLGA